MSQLYGPDGKAMGNPFVEALKDMDGAASIMLTLYKDGTLTVDAEVNDSVYPNGLLIVDALKMLNDAGRQLYELSDDKEEVADGDTV